MSDQLHLIPEEGAPAAPKLYDVVAERDPYMVPSRAQWDALRAEAAMLREALESVRALKKPHPKCRDAHETVAIAESALSTPADDWLAKHDEKKNAEVARLREALGRVIGDHTAPSDCFSTGPLTGNPVMDSACPACDAIAALSTPSDDWLERKVAEARKAVLLEVIGAARSGDTMGNFFQWLEKEAANG